MRRSIRLSRGIERLTIDSQMKLSSASMEQPTKRKKMIVKPQMAEPLVYEEPSKCRPAETKASFSDRQDVSRWNQSKANIVLIQVQHAMLHYAANNKRDVTEQQARKMLSVVKEIREYLNTRPASRERIDEQSLTQLANYENRPLLDIVQLSENVLNKYLQTFEKKKRSPDINKGRKISVGSAMKHIPREKNTSVESKFPRLSATLKNDKELVKTKTTHSVNQPKRRLKTQRTAIDQQQVPTKRKYKIGCFEFEKQSDLLETKNEVSKPTRTVTDVRELSKFGGVTQRIKYARVPNKDEFFESSGVSELITDDSFNW